MVTRECSSPAVPPSPSVLAKLPTSTSALHTPNAGVKNATAAATAAADGDASAPDSFRCSPTDTATAATSSKTENDDGQENQPPPPEATLVNNKFGSSALSRSMEKPMKMVEALPAKCLKRERPNSLETTPVAPALSGPGNAVAAGSATISTACILVSPQNKKRQRTDSDDEREDCQRLQQDRHQSTLGSPLKVFKKGSAAGVSSSFRPMGVRPRALSTSSTFGFPNKRGHATEPLQRVLPFASTDENRACMPTSPTLLRSSVNKKLHFFPLEKHVGAANNVDGNKVGARPAGESEDDESPTMSPHNKRATPHHLTGPLSKNADAPLTKLERGIASPMMASGKDVCVAAEAESKTGKQEVTIVAPALPSGALGDGKEYAASNASTSFLGNDAIYSSEDEYDDGEQVDTSPSPEDPQMFCMNDPTDAEKYPDIGATDGGLTYVDAETTVNRNGLDLFAPLKDPPSRFGRAPRPGFFSPDGVQKRLTCHETFVSPMYGPSGSSSTTSAGCNQIFSNNNPMAFDGLELNILTSLEPLHSSPAAAFGNVPPPNLPQPRPFLAQPSAVFADPIFATGPGSTMMNRQEEPSVFSDEEEDEVDQICMPEEGFAMYFKVCGGKKERRAKGAGAEEGKWLEFLIQEHKIPKPTRDGLISPYEPSQRIVATPTIPSKDDELEEWDQAVKEEMAQRNIALMTWRQSEIKCMPNANYFCYQQNVKDASRAVLVNWIMEVCSELCLSRTAAQLAINITDRFFSKTCGVPAALFQMIGAAALAIAAKIEEKDPPKMNQWAVFSGSDFATGEQMKAVEAKIMKLLQWEMSPPLPSDWLYLYLSNASFLKPDFFENFLKRFRPEEGVSELIRTEMTFDVHDFVEAIGLVDIFMHMQLSLSFPPSMMTAAALYVVWIRESKFSNDPTVNELECQKYLKECTRYEVEQIKDCIDLMEFEICPIKYNGIRDFEGEYSDALIHEIQAPYVKASSKPESQTMVFSRVADIQLRFYHQPQYPELHQYLSRGTPGYALN